MKFNRKKGNKNQHLQTKCHFQIQSSFKVIMLLFIWSGTLEIKLRDPWYSHGLQTASWTIPHTVQTVDV